MIFLVDGGEHLDVLEVELPPKILLLLGVGRLVTGFPKPVFVKDEKAVNRVYNHQTDEFLLFQVVLNPL